MAARPRRKSALAEDHAHAAGAAVSVPPVKASRRTLDVITGDAANTVPSLDGLIHERTRLSIVTALAGGALRSHTELRDLLSLSDGNLSVHARKLEDAGYLQCTKEFAGRTPKTSYRLTPAGQRAFDEYLAHLEHLINAMKKR